MQLAIVVFAAIATAYAARVPRRPRMLTASDILIGLVGGIAGLSVAYVLRGAGGELGIALLIGCGLALGLQSGQYIAL